MPTRAKKEEEMNNDVTRTLKEGLNILTAEELLVLSYTGHCVSDGGILNFTWLESPLELTVTREP